MEIIADLLELVSAAASRQVVSNMVTTGLFVVALLVVAAVAFKWARGEQRRVAGRKSSAWGGDDCPAADIAIAVGVGALFCAFVFLTNILDIAIAFDYKVIQLMRQLIR